MIGVPCTQFFVKSLKKGETKLLFNILPEYFKHVSSHPHTLLTRFYGLHRIILSGRHKVKVASMPTLVPGRVDKCTYSFQFDFVVMGNLFNTKMLLHQKFDLKGSTLGRTAGANK